MDDGEQILQDLLKDGWFARRGSSKADDQLWEEPKDLQAIVSCMRSPLTSQPAKRLYNLSTMRTRSNDEQNFKFYIDIFLISKN